MIPNPCYNTSEAWSQVIVPEKGHSATGHTRCHPYLISPTPGITCFPSNTKQRVTITCSALDFISRLVPHIPPKGVQIVRYAGLYARNIKRKLGDIVRTALEAIRLQVPLFDLEPVLQSFQHLDWDERIGWATPPEQGLERTWQPLESESLGRGVFPRTIDGQGALFSGS